MTDGKHRTRLYPGRAVRTIGGLLLAMTLLLGLLACGKAMKVPPATEPDVEAIQTPKVTDLTLGPGDEIEVSVWRNPDLGGKYVVNATGQIFIPIVGSVETAGVGVTELRQKIAESLQAYLKDPQVSLTVLTVRSRKFFVLGEVARPGIFYMSNDNMSLVQAIALSGGLTGDAKSKEIFRISSAGPNGRIEAYDVHRLLKEGDLAQNATIQTGDLIYVPRTTIANVDRFFLHLMNIVRPIVYLERAIILGPTTGDAIQGDRGVIVINGN